MPIRSVYIGGKLSNRILRFIGLQTVPEHPVFGVIFCKILWYRNGPTEVKSKEWNVDESLLIQDKNQFADLRWGEFKEQIIIILTVG